MKEVPVKAQKSKVAKSSKTSSLFTNFATYLGYLTDTLGLLMSVAAIVFNTNKWLVVALGLISLTLAILRLSRYRLQLDQLKFYERILSSIQKRKDYAAPTAATTAIAALARRKKVQRQGAMIVLLLSLVVYAVARLRWEAPLSVAVVTALAGGCILLQLSDAALDYRIRRGLYGTNEYEARQIISFVLNHAEGTDISGGLGAADIEIVAATERLLHENWGVATS